MMIQANEQSIESKTMTKTSLFVDYDASPSCSVTQCFVKIAFNV